MTKKINIHKYSIMQQTKAQRILIQLKNFKKSIFSQDISHFHSILHQAKSKVPVGVRSA